MPKKKLQIWKKCLTPKNKTKCSVLKTKPLQVLQFSKKPVLQSKQLHKAPKEKNMYMNYMLNIKYIIVLTFQTDTDKKNRFK